MKNLIAFLAATGASTVMLPADAASDEALEQIIVTGSRAHNTGRATNTGRSTNTATL